MNAEEPVDSQAQGTEEPVTPELAAEEPAELAEEPAELAEEPAELAGELEPIIEESASVSEVEEEPPNTKTKETCESSTPSPASAQAPWPPSGV